MLGQQALRCRPLDGGMGCRRSSRRDVVLVHPCSLDDRNDGLLRNIPRFVDDMRIYDLFHTTQFLVFQRKCDVQSVPDSVLFDRQAQL